MTRKNIDSGGYALIADAGRDLVVLGEDGAELARCKAVSIPATGTALTWTEAPEQIAPEPAAEEDAKAARIAALEAELAALKEQ